MTPVVCLGLGTEPEPRFSDENLHSRKECKFPAGTLNLAQIIKTTNFRSLPEELIRDLDVERDILWEGTLVLKEENRGYESPIIEGFSALEQLLDNTTAPIDMLQLPAEYSITTAIFSGANTGLFG
jgi:hypothetical protein